METLYHIGVNMMTQNEKYALVFWKDRYIVYCFTNWTATNEIGLRFCIRR